VTPGIRIANLYYLLCYAWNHVEERKVVRLAELERLERVQDLLGKVLGMGAHRLVRPGLDRSYVEVRQDLRGIRGKLRVSDMAKRALRSRSMAACEFEELSVDVLHNRILRSTLDRLARVDDLDRHVRREVRSAARKLGGVSTIRLGRGLFGQVQLDRNRRLYRFLIAVCRLVREQSLVDERSGAVRFRDLGEPRMHQLFEDFLVGFYRKEQKRFRVNPDGRGIPWHGRDAHAPDVRRRIPGMVADVILESAERCIVVDAKYYGEGALSGDTLRSGHLFQILAYGRNREAARAPRARHEGMLLYPTVGGREVRIDLHLEGHDIRVRSIDLDRDWRSIHRDLLDFLGTRLTA